MPGIDRNKALLHECRGQTGGARRPGGGSGHAGSGHRLGPAPGYPQGGTFPPHPPTQDREAGDWETDQEPHPLRVRQGGQGGGFGARNGTTRVSLQATTQQIAGGCSETAARVVGGRRQRQVSADNRTTPAIGGDPGLREKDLGRGTSAAQRNISGRLPRFSHCTRCANHAQREANPRCV